MSDTPISTTTAAVVEPNPQHLAVLERLGQLEQALLAKDPLMKNHLFEIHKLLITYEDLAHLLKDEEIGILMSAQQIHTNTILVQSASTASGKAKAVKAGAKLTIGDL